MTTNFIEHPLKTVLKEIKTRPNNIYTWIPINLSCRISIKIDQKEATRWRKEVAKENNGQVPAFFARDLFLGGV